MQGAVPSMEVPGSYLEFPQIGEDLSGVRRRDPQNPHGSGAVMSVYRETEHPCMAVTNLLAERRQAAADSRFWTPSIIALELSAE